MLQLIQPGYRIFEPPKLALEPDRLSIRNDARVRCGKRRIARARRSDVAGDRDGRSRCRNGIENVGLRHQGSSSQKKNVAGQCRLRAPVGPLDQRPSDWRIKGRNRNAPVLLPHASCRVQKWRPSGRNAGNRCEFSARDASIFVTCEAVPPVFASIRKMPPYAVGANKIVPSRPQVPPRESSGASLSVRDGPPRDFNRLQLPLCEKSERLAVRRPEGINRILGSTKELRFRVGQRAHPEAWPPARLLPQRRLVDRQAISQSVARR